jgi:hypothetical protein
VKLNLYVLLKAMTTTTRIAKAITIQENEYSIVWNHGARLLGKWWWRVGVNRASPTETVIIVWYGPIWSLYLVSFRFTFVRLFAEYLSINFHSKSCEIFNGSRRRYRKVLFAQKIISIYIYTLKAFLLLADGRMMMIIIIIYFLFDNLSKCRVDY